MIPWNRAFSSKQEFEKEQISDGWEKISCPFTPLEGQEIEIWCRSHWSGYSCEVFCYELKDFFESHLEDIPEAEKTVEEWLTTILLDKYSLDQDEWFISSLRPGEGWHKAPDGEEHFYIEAEDPNYDG
jgi:hypothetical protein